MLLCSCTDHYHEVKIINFLYVDMFDVFLGPNTVEFIQKTFTQVNDMMLW